MSHTFDGYGESSPMMMGSPGSPASPLQSQFLPGYLLGDTTQHGVSPVSRLWTTATSPSPPKSTHRSSNITSPLGTSYISTPGHREAIRPKDRPGAPPTKSLISHSSPAPASPFTSFHQTPSRGFHTPGPSSNPGFSLNMSENIGDSSQLHLAANTKLPPSPAQMDPFFTQGESLKSEDILDETWITVFGFPPAAASFILQQFSQYGNIVKHVIASEGNWMHLHYQSKLQAKKALSKNGKMFAGNIMVGVTPCIEKSVMEVKENVPLPGTPVINTGLKDTPGTPKGTPIRPLTSAYRSARGENEVVRNNQAPQKSNTFVSKAMEYMFGW